MEDFDREEEETIDQEELLVDLAKGSNHPVETFNRAHAGSTTLAKNTVMHRAYRALDGHPPRGATR